MRVVLISSTWRMGNRPANKLAKVSGVMTSSDTMASTLMNVYSSDEHGMLKSELI